MVSGITLTDAWNVPVGMRQQAGMLRGVGQPPTSLQRTLRAFPVTIAVLVGVCSIFALQQHAGPEAIFVSTAEPSVSWIVAPLAHQGAVHLLGNVGALLLLLPAVRLRWGVRRAAVLAGASLWLPLVVGYVIAPGTMVGMGASAAVFALVPLAYLGDPRTSLVTGAAASSAETVVNGLLATISIAFVAWAVLAWGYVGGVSATAHAMGGLAGLALLGVVAAVE